MTTKGSFNYIGSKNNPYHYLYGIEKGQKHLIMEIVDDCKVVADGVFLFFGQVDVLEYGKNFIENVIALRNSCKKTFLVDEGNIKYSAYDGILYDKKYTQLIRSPKQKTSVEIKDSITSIGQEAFKGCSRLTNIIIPENVRSIGESAFKNCKSLSAITMHDGITNIGQETFVGCSNLTSITIPKSLVNIESGMFIGCSALKSIVIPSGVTYIGDCAFSHCTSLQSITIPKSVIKIGTMAFNDVARGKIIKGESGSYAEKYAKKNKIKFEAL